jgi:uncharacterized membrane protein YqjE
MDDEGAPAAGPATRLVKSVARLTGTLLAIVQTRIDLLSAEISEDFERGLRIVLWGVAAVLAGALGALLAGITIIAYFWDSHRLTAAACVTVVFVAVSLAAAGIARAHLRDKPRMLDATRTELRRDAEALRGEP